METNAYPRSLSERKRYLGWKSFAAWLYLYQSSSTQPYGYHFMLENVKSEH